MTFRQLRIKQHLYYCLLIALKLAQNKAAAFSAQQKNAFILEWLSSASRNKLFANEADDEISWLLTTISTSPLHYDPEAMLENIYHTSHSWLLAYCIKAGIDNN